MRWIANCILVCVAIAMLAGCKSEKSKTAAPAPVRPVLSVVVQPLAVGNEGFAGTIQPQVQTIRGFQVLGRIKTREVNVGDLVKKGQILATLDPLLFDLAVKSSSAELVKAKSQLKNDQAAVVRSTTLYGKQVTSKAELEVAQQARDASIAVVQQAEANLVKAREQLQFTKLIADIDGVVTTTDAQVGQTVAAGRKIMTLARMDLRDAIVDLSPDALADLAIGTPFEIRLQVDPSLVLSGRLREIAPEAEASTRTRRVKIGLDAMTDAFRLGATITAAPVVRGKANLHIEIPQTALLERDGKALVWLVDAEKKTVSTRRVEIAERRDDHVIVVSGLQPGSRVVVAGVNSLVEGQAVRIMDGAVE